MKHHKNNTRANVSGHRTRAAETPNRGGGGLEEIERSGPRDGGNAETG